MIPKSNTEYWNAKLARNTAQDAENIRRLEQDGWRIFIVWEPEEPLKHFKAFIKQITTV